MKQIISFRNPPCVYTLIFYKWRRARVNMRHNKTKENLPASGKILVFRIADECWVMWSKLERLALNDHKASESKHKKPLRSGGRGKEITPFYHTHLNHLHLVKKHFLKSGNQCFHRNIWQHKPHHYRKSVVSQLKLAIHSSSLSITESNI